MKPQRTSSMFAACLTLACLLGAGQAVAGAVATSPVGRDGNVVPSALTVVDGDAVTLSTETPRKLAEAPKKAVRSDARPNATEQDALCAWAYSATRSGQGLTKQMPTLLSFLIAQCATTAAGRLMQK